MFKISVIIPTYKPQDYLWECLDSLLIQTFPKEDFEIILVLNGCIEPYKSKIEQYIVDKMQGVNVNFIHTEVGGVSNARNIALDQTRGEFITFLDDDDYFSKTTLERIYTKASRDCIAVFKPLAFYDNSREFFDYSRTKEFENNKSESTVPFYKVRKVFGGPVMKLIHRDIIGSRRYDLSFKNGEDSLFMFLISDRMKNVTFASDDAIYYRRVRINSAATSTRSFGDVFRNSIRLIMEYTRIYVGNMKEYNFRFYATRVLGAVRAILNYNKVTY